jgi:hypothetical protein
MINFELEWREVPCTGEPCIVCQESIFGKQYQLYTIINERATPLEQVACASCYMENEKEED